MFCTKCGKQIADNSKFCPFCGETIDEYYRTQEIPVTPSADPLLANTTQTVIENTASIPPIQETKPVKKDEKKPSKTVWIVLAVCLLAAVGIGIWYTSQGGITPSSNTVHNTPSQETHHEEPAPEATDTVEEKEESSRPAGTVGQVESETFRIRIIADNIKIRDYPSTTGNHIGKVSKGQTYDAYETRVNEGYTWYRIGDDKWCADKNGEWIQIIQ